MERQNLFADFFGSEKVSGGNSNKYLIQSKKGAKPLISLFDYISFGGFAVAPIPLRTKIFNLIEIHIRGFSVAGRPRAPSQKKYIYN